MRQNSWALITGASSGIGLKYAEKLGSMGYNLIIVSNERDKINIIAKELASKYNILSDGLYIDLARGSAAKELFDYCSSKQIDILINNAGIFNFKDFTDTNIQRIETMINLHIVTVTLLCRLFGEQMKERKKGYILNMSSMSAWMNIPGIALYSSSKTFIKAFSKALYHELKPYNVSVTTVLPGAVATDLYRLSEKHQKLGLNLGILITPEKMVEKAINAMFKKKMLFIPGAINRLFIPLMTITPVWIIRIIRKKIAKHEF